MILTNDEFNAKFKIVRNNADGNCFFESIEHILNFSEYEITYGITKAKQIREMVGEFYRNFDRDIDYPESTIEYRIKMGILFDNVDDEMQHDYNIWNDKVWASMTDVLICALIFKININLYVKNTSFTIEEDDVVETSIYELSKIKTQYNFKTTIHLLYSGGNHFEALDRKQ